MNGKEENVDLGKLCGKHLIDGQVLRNKVMHSAFSEPLERVSKQELIRSAHAVFAYFRELSQKLPMTFQYMNVLLDRKSVK